MLKFQTKKGTVNPWVTSSSLVGGAIYIKGLSRFLGKPFFFGLPLGYFQKE